MSHRLPQTIERPIERRRTLTDRLPSLESFQGRRGELTLAAGVVVILLLINTEAVVTADLRAHDLQVRLGPIDLTQSLARWVNEGLLTVVFALACRTLKRELLAGTATAASLWPGSLACLVGAGAAAVFSGSYLDLRSVEFEALAVAGVMLTAVTVLRVSGMWWMPAFVLAGAGLWLAVFAAGINAALVGVVCGSLYPIVVHRAENAEVGAGSYATVGYRKMAALPGG